MNRTILIIAFHFPPIAASSGMQRALKTVRYLRKDGWRPVVLTANSRAYDIVNDSQLAEIPDDVVVRRAFCLDAKRHFAVGGRYPGFLTWPDAWITWYPGAVLAGRRLIRQYQPAIIWSTFPINTANLVARSLAKWSGLPWVADLRDPITLPGYPPERARFRLARRIEQSVMEGASRVIFTADFTRQIYTDRYPEIKDKTALIRNGYDEENFPPRGTSEKNPERPLTILHSGSMQLKGRHPGCFLEAVANLKANRIVSEGKVRIVFRASRHEGQYVPLAEKLGIADIVTFEPPLPYEQAIAEMVEADALLLFQGTPYNNSVPAKLFEYFFAGKPILGILDKIGETQRVLESVGISQTASIDDAKDIQKHLALLVSNSGTVSSFRAEPSAITEYSRRHQTLKLSALLNDVAEESQDLK